MPIIDRQTVSSETPGLPGRHYYPGLDGLRLVSALAVLLTHVAFQTGHNNGHMFFDRVLGRLDLAVAVFFALSGFLLWQPEPEYKHPVWSYYLNRAARILPAYWVVVLFAFAVEPALRSARLTVFAANMTLTHIYQPLTLVEGLTQMWSLDVEVSFYILLPLILLALRRITSTTYRLIIIGLTTLGSILWWLVPLPYTHSGIDLHTTLLGYWCWFAVGIVIKEVTLARWKPYSWLSFIYAHLCCFLPLIAGLYAVAASSLGGAPGLFNPTITQRIIRLVIGGLIAALLVGKYVHATHTNQKVWLAKPLCAALGRWGYGIFIWHLLILSMVMALLEIFPFQGHILLIGSLTIIISIIVGGISYICIEEPARRLAKSLETRRLPRVKTEYNSNYSYKT